MTFWVFLLAVGCAVEGLSPAVHAALAKENVLRLENEFNLVEVALPNGRITRIRDKGTGLELIAEPRLADNFKLSLPLPGQYAWQATEGNYVLGREQRLTSHRQEGNSLWLEWAGRMKGSAGRSHRLVVRMQIALVTEAIRFDLRLENDSKLELGEVYYPILGGLQGLGQTDLLRKETELVVPTPNEARPARIFETFANMSWLGVFGPEQFYSYPDTLSMPWVELSQAALNRSVYFGAHDPARRYKVLHLELCPGIAPSRAGGNWPTAQELEGAPAGVKMCFVHVPYHPPGQPFEASPVVLRFHGGDWRDGARCYGAWFTSAKGGQAPRQDWVGQVGAFAECGAVPFKEIPDRARRAAGVGVKGLLLREWKAGGRENGVPDFTVDPKLGTADELRDAIRQCHQLGVKVMLLMNLGPVSQRSLAHSGVIGADNTLARPPSTLFHRMGEGRGEGSGSRPPHTQPPGNPWFRYACLDRWGIPYTAVGWPEPNSITGGHGAGERRFWVSPSHPDLQARLSAQVRELAALGVDGLHWQGFFGRPLDFNPGLGRTPDRASWEGGLEAWRKIASAGRAANPIFAMSTDSLWDGILSETMVCSAEVRELTPLRVAFPSLQGTFTLLDEEAMKQLADAAKGTSPNAKRKVVFELASSADLNGWEREGSAFAIGSSPGLIPRATLNSYVVGGESATGTATSPVFEVSSDYETIEVIFQGGWSESVDGKENLTLQFIDAGSGLVLEELAPPGIHVLTTKKLGTEKLIGKSVRLRLVDQNTNTSYAWIGLRQVTLESKRR